uniref:Putative CopG-like protein n=1 Tax=Saccharolobus islandicus TaxID=43080 RepID=A8TKN0_SACIS|nr:hypothetical protein [Sulfolobus islandicus]ABV26261.1 putative CopG-like protein [Sulfolobus islandicus]
MPNKYSVKRIKKVSCPYGRHCFNDSSICGHIGYYAECPLTFEDKLYSEIKEGGYEGVDPYTLFRSLRRVRLNEDC